EHGHNGAGTLPPNTESELYATAAFAEAGGNSTLEVSFAPGSEEMNAHAGMWEIKDGVLSATQAGDQLGEDDVKMVPRSYVAHRYFSTDHVIIEADLLVQSLEDDFPIDASAPRFGEVALRIKDHQVSVHASP